MFKTTIAALAIALASAVPAAAQLNNNRFGTTGNSMQLYDPQGGYHGNLNGNRFDPNSVANPFGQYGSRFSPDSVNNPFGTYTHPAPPVGAYRPY